ncbi:MAG: putative repair protein RecO [Nitrospira sp.]|jgi:DNA repair protein RecO (recombination protein O)|nr:putative repair protein RecO [Nitrospira sp.]
MPLLKTPAIVLHSRKWGDADRIVTFYTIRLGKLRGVARGARRLKSRLGGMIEPFSLCHLDLYEKPGDSLYRISQVALDEPFSKFRSDLTLMAAAGRMVNLVSAVMADGDAEPRVFEALEAGLRTLQESRDAAWTALLFQIRLLGITGFRPQTEQCAACGRVHQSPLTQFSPLAGGIVCDRCASRQPFRCTALSRGSVAFLQQAVHMQPGLMSRLHAVGQVRAEIESAIEGYVTVVAGRRLPPVDFLTTGSLV